MSKLDWEKVNRERRVNYRPAPRARPATSRQLAYIEGLCLQKGQRIPKLPKTLGGAHDLIERLLEMPDVEVHERIEPEPSVQETTRQVIVAEMRERFPKLTPMSVNSLLQLFGAIDEVSALFVLDGLMTDEAPEEPGELVLHILKRFLAEFGDVIEDDRTLV